MAIDYKHRDTLLILHYLQQHKDDTSIDAILQHSGAEKLCVYPALFALEQDGRLEGTPKQVRLRQRNIGTKDYLQLKIRMSE